MRSSESPPEKRAIQNSPKFRYPRFSDVGTSPTPSPRPSREDSYFWMDRFLAPGTPPAIRDDQSPLVQADNIFQFNPDRRKVQRGDVQPLRHRPLAVIPEYASVVYKPTVSNETNSDKTERGKIRSKKQQTPQPEPEPPKIHSRLTTADFESVIWPSIQEKVRSLVEEKVSQHVERMLRERKAELESLTRPPLLKADSSPELYHAYVQFLQERIKATAKNSPMIRKTEAVMSLVMDLESGLEISLRKHLAQIAARENGQEDQDLAIGEREDHEEEYHGIDDEDTIIIPDEDHSDYQDDPDDVDEEDRILPSTERCTPVTSPRIMNQLRKYNTRYQESRRRAASESEAHSRVLGPLSGYSNIPTGISEPQEASGTPRKVIELEDTPNSKGEPERILNPKKRELAKTPSPTRAISKRRCTAKHSPRLTHSPASSESSYFPSLAEIFNSSLGRQSSPATQPSPSRSQHSLFNSPTPSPAMSRQKETGDISGNTGAAPKPPVPLFSESPGLFMTPDPVSTNKSFDFKRSASRSAQEVGQTQHESKSPARFRESTADFEAMDPSEQLLLLFRKIRGKES
ncbi:hypothetical protein FSPOR_5057 [Fusarium sporotrichioides]|uniref:Uncharacterized protein n=1 Tax=Fusarium sporotrichioides TaxID=5514 RepID=A0A395S8W9_FUSSP|nr:hypothetical protein FSPOR_5057 [Fusarium sporotrichioides]